jgi:hypothetical protein
MMRRRAGRASDEYSACAAGPHQERGSFANPAYPLPRVITRQAAAIGVIMITSR